MEKKLYAQFSFSSVSGKEYLVEIYRTPDYEEQEYTPLILTASGENCFTVTESGEKSLFTPVHTQSGYMRIIDDGSHISSLIARDNLDLQVRLFHVGKSKSLAWIGYIKPEKYTTKLWAGLQVFEIPLICPLTALEGVFLPRDFAWHGVKKIKTILEYCLSETNIDFPASEWTTTCERATLVNFLDLSLNTMLWMETNEEFDAVYYNAHHNDEDYDEESNPRQRGTSNCLHIIEDICRYVGASMHVVGDTIHFAAHDKAINDFTKVFAATEIKAAPIYLNDLEYIGTNHTIRMLPGANSVKLTSSVHAVDKVIEMPFKEWPSARYNSWHGGLQSDTVDCMDASWFKEDVLNIDKFGNLNHPYDFRSCSFDVHQYSTVYPLDMIHYDSYTREGVINRTKTSYADNTGLTFVPYRTRNQNVNYEPLNNVVGEFYIKSYIPHHFSGGVIAVNMDVESSLIKDGKWQKLGSVDISGKVIELSIKLGDKYFNMDYYDRKPQSDPLVAYGELTGEVMWSPTQVWRPFLLTGQGIRSNKRLEQIEYNNVSGFLIPMPAGLSGPVEIGIRICPFFKFILHDDQGRSEDMYSAWTSDKIAYDSRGNAYIPAAYTVDTTVIKSLDISYHLPIDYPLEPKSENIITLINDTSQHDDVSVANSFTEYRNGKNCYGYGLLIDESYGFHSHEHNLARIRKDLEHELAQRIFLQHSAPVHHVSITTRSSQIDWRKSYLSGLAEADGNLSVVAINRNYSEDTQELKLIETR